MTNKQSQTAGRKRACADEVWCRNNATTEEKMAFWNHWCVTQWGMPTFGIMRQCIIATRAATEARNA
jgi:hypothetical protein